MVLYFGEDPNKQETTNIFATFAEFIRKFEVCIKHALFMINGYNSSHIYLIMSPIYDPFG